MQHQGPRSYKNVASRGIELRLTPVLSLDLVASDITVHINNIVSMGSRYMDFVARCRAADIGRELHI